MLIIITFIYQSVSHTYIHTRSYKYFIDLFNNNNMVEVMMMITNIFEDYSVPDIVINTIHFISFYSHSLMRLTLLFCFYRLGN